MSKLSDVAYGCDLLHSTRITDQGKGLNELKRLLEDDRVKTSITTSHKGKRKPNWNTICNAVYEYLKKECESFMKSHHSWSDTSRANKTKKLVDVFLFMKKILRVISSENVKLETVLLLEYLIELLHEEVFVENFGVPILKIINDAILGNRKISSEVPKANICELLNICESRMCQDDEKMKFIVSSVLVSLTRIIVKNMDFVDNLQFHDIYVASVKSLDNVKAYHVIDNVFTAANLYIKWSSLTHRELCCNFGEDCLDYVLKLWRENFSDTTLRHITSFCSLQITIHHPNMAVESSLGYYAKNHEAWCSKLYSMIIAADLLLYKQQSGMQHRFKESKTAVYDEGCVTLVGEAACVIFKMMRKSSFIMPKMVISCKSFVSGINFDDLSSILSCFKVGRNKTIEEIGKPWFAVLNFLLVNHEGLFNHDILTSILVKFHHLLMNASFESLGPSGVGVIKKSLTLLAHQNINRDKVSTLSSIWKDCWNIAVSCLVTNRRHTNICALKFLETLVEFDKCINQNFYISTGVSKSAKSFWSTLYLQVSPSIDSIRLATKLVQLYGIQCDENAVFSTVLRTTTINMEFTQCAEYMNLYENNTLKLLILHWVLGFKQENVTEQQNNLTQSYRFSDKDDIQDLSVVTPNAFSKMDDIYNLVEAVSELLAAVSYKDSKGAVNFLSHKRVELDVKDITDLFLRPEFVTGFQYFNIQAMPWFENDQRQSNECLTLPKCDVTSEVITGILFCNLNQIVENARKYSSKNMSKHFLKIFQSFFLYANTVGNLLYLHHKSDAVSSKHFEEWINLVVQFVKTIVIHLEDKLFMISDDTLSEISLCLSQFLEIFSKRLFGHTGTTIVPVSKISKLRHPFISIFQIILHQFRSERSKNELAEAESPNSHDDVLGLTQTLATSSSSRGYKRRKYNMEAEPPTKQTKLSEKTAEEAKSNNINKSDLLWDHEFTRNIVRLATAIRCVFQYDDATRDVLKIGLELDPSNPSDLCCIYTIVDQICSVERSLPTQYISDLLDIYQDVFGEWYKEQEISLKFLVLFAKTAQRILADTNGSSDGDIAKRINDIVGIFWKLALSNKCSYLTRMGISACVLANIQTSPNAMSKNLFDKILKLLSDPHASVKGLTIYILAKCQSVCQNSVLERHEDEFLAFATQLISQASTKCAIESTETLPLLVTTLHCIFVCLPCQSYNIEVEAHYLLCMVESLTQKFRNLFNCDELCSRCLAWISKHAFKSVFNYTLPEESFQTAYGTRHLTKTLFRWITSRSGKLIEKTESFPYTLYGYDNMKTFCNDFVKDTFPAILCAVQDYGELTAMYEAYFSNYHNITGLSSLIKLCLPEICQMLPPNENLNPNLLAIFDDIYQRKNCYQYLLGDCAGHVLVDIFMKNNSDISLQSKLNHIVKLMQTGGSKVKTAPITSLSMVLSEVVFSKRKCTLVDMFTRIRHLFEKAWFGHEYKHCTEIYIRIVSLLLNGSKIPETTMAYFFNDVISVITRSFTEIDEKMDKSENHLKYSFESANMMIELLAKISMFLHRCVLSVKQTIGMNKLAVLIVNLLLKCEKFNEKVCDLKLSTAEDFKNTLENLTTVVKSLSEDSTFYKFYAFIDESERPSLEDCFVALEECYAAFNSLEITKFHNPIMDKICECFITHLRIENELVGEETQKRLVDSILIMLKILKTQTSENLSLVEAVIEIYLHISSLPVMLNPSPVPVHENLDLLFISDVITTLIRTVFSQSAEVRHTAITCIKNIVKIPDVKVHLQSLSRNDGLLDSILTLLQSDTERKPTFVSKSLEHLKNLLEDIENISDEDTICLFASRIIGFCQNAIFHSLKPICHKLEKMSALILPRVIHDILLHDPTQKAKNEISKFFKVCFKRVIDNPQKEQRMCVFLDVIQYLRTQDISEIDAHFQKQGKSGGKSNSWDNNFWLDVDYMDLARVAVRYSRPFMAVLYAEIWKESFENNSSLSKPVTCRSLSRALNGFASQNFPSPVANMQTQSDNDQLMIEILTQAYCKIEDLDSLYGLAGNSWNPALMMHIHSMESDWFKALEDYNVLMTRCNSSWAVDGIIQSLQWLGLTHIAETYKNTTVNSSKTVSNNRHFEDAYQMAQWDDTSLKELFLSNVNQCQTYLKDHHPSLNPLIKDMWKGVLSSLENDPSSLNIFGSKTLDCIGKLTVIRDLLSAKKYMLEDNNEKDAIESSVEKLSLSILPVESSLFSSYSCAESIILNRNRLIEIMTRGANHFDQPATQNVIRANLALQIDLAMKSNREKMALQLIESTMNCIISSGQFSINTNEEYHQLLLKKAQVLWNADRKVHAISVSLDLQHILEEGIKDDEQLDGAHTVYHLAKVLQLSGTWINEMKMESPSIIIENYFQQSVQIASKQTLNHQDSNSPLTKAKFDKLHISGYKILAKFADAQYREVVEYMTSKEFEHKRNLAREAKQEISKTSSNPIQGQNQKYLCLLQKNYKMDHRDFTNILDQKEKFLLCAVENYIKCLSLSDEDDLLMYRICSLWFENTQSASLPGLMHSACSELKTHKFVDISYQLAARLDKKSQDKNFQSTLSKLLKKVAIDHPHHVLPVLFALAYAHRDSEFPKIKQKKSTSTTTDATSAAAQSILNEIKKVKPELVAMMGNLSDAYIEFANCDVTKYSRMPSTPISFEKNLLLTKYCDSRMKDKYTGLAIPTIEIPINKHGNYQTILQSTSLSYFKGYFQLCGGINLPKIVVAIASDGSERKHLVKGRDDLRQDAVMQHVFKVVNALLMQNEGSQNLRMCSYKVVPLSQRSGLVEWCEGTVPIGNYLIGVPAQRNFGAHHLYRPNDLISVECRKKLHAANGKSHRQKLEIYRDICKRFKPVFRHFFYENFVVPDKWFQCRTAYCKSVSISSMVGYILGLGDRHVQNILINKTTGEVIHIDLGVAFEQGKCLPTPEMVPFRLTRDLVDAFGSSGVEGSFRRNCERCLRVLRSSIDIIATIVEVLLHDPLHDWMMTSNKALQVQRDDASNIESEMTASVLNASTVAELLQNEVVGTTGSNSRCSLAGRALLRVKEKLRGLESGSVLSVEGQVNMLIQQATDEEKLCAMFVGWQPYI